jgi:hypothetical protein
MGPTKHCTGCGQEKLRTEFHPRSCRGPNGVESKCRICRNRRRHLRRDNRVREKVRYLKLSYNLTIEALEAMRESQNGYCASCGVHESVLFRKLVVDHNHETGRVRALLCDACNSAEGLLKTSDRALALAKYIEHQARIDRSKKSLV